MRFADGSSPHGNRVVVPARIAAKVEKVASEFLAKRGKRLVITDGVRTPEDQAILILAKLNSDGEKKTKSLYGNGKNIKAIIKAAKAETLPQRRLEAVTAVIQAQVDSGKYVSKHLMDSGVDVRTSGLSKRDLKVLREIISANGGKPLPEPNTGTGPHDHVSF